MVSLSKLQYQVSTLGSEASLKNKVTKQILISNIIQSKRKFCPLINLFLCMIFFPFFFKSLESEHLLAILKDSYLATIYDVPTFILLIIVKFTYVPNFYCKVSFYNHSIFPIVSKTCPIKLKTYITA